MSILYSFTNKIHMSEKYQLTKNFKDELQKHVIDNTFQSLSINHKNMLFKYLDKIIVYISIKFQIFEQDVYEKQLRQNNYRDVKGILSLLLPYIDDDANTKKKNIKSLNDIYVKKQSSSSPTSSNITTSEPKYEYSNLQYGRCIRSPNGQHHEINFDESHLLNNFILLKQTILSIANKLYVNWVNIRPISLEKYMDSVLFNVTLAYHRNHMIPISDVTKPNPSAYNGLYIGDFYDTIANNLFNSVKNIKWTIYNTSRTKEYGTIPYLLLLNSVIPIQNCADNIVWNSLSTQDKTTFTESWRILASTISSSTSIKQFTNLTLQRLTKSLIIFFNKYYTNLTKAIHDKEYVKFTLNDDQQLNEENLHQLNVRATRIDESIRSLHPRHMYAYIRDTIQKLKLTWYYVRLAHKTNKLKTIKEFSNDGISLRPNLTAENKKQESRGMSLKNIYNYSKSLTHYTQKSQYLPYPTHWKSLTHADKLIIQKRINWAPTIRNSNETMKWFNISRYVIRTFKLDKLSKHRRSERIIGHNNNIITNVMAIITDVVFEIMIRAGTLSEFVSDTKITDESRFISTSSNVRRQKQIDVLKQRVFYNNDPDPEINNIDDWNKSYYFLTSQTYSELSPIKYKDKNTGRLKEQTYFEHMTTGTNSAWCFMYALDWVSQIAFFHKYMNNRVMFVTGSTGVGKSTQIPKLLLYALKAVDYKNTGKVVCTQPRVSPAVGIPVGAVSPQMGVSIFEYNESLKTDIKTSNYNIQYKHQKGNHVSNINNLMLRFVTDGTLYHELKANPILKKTFKQDAGDFTYSDKNIYDIVIVDEAHEHNINMDLILTMMKYPLQYNNDIKLVIISATMGDDEPAYRRYYRDINDNKKYPFDTLLSQYNLDRINVERRLHISPPGQTTRFTINEYYQPNKTPEEIALDILKTGGTNGGDILLFQPGTREINTTVGYLNSNTSSDVIAVGYHAKIDQTLRDQIERLNADNKKFFRVPGNTAGPFKQIIIVATNIAEASITIPTLKYVIDTGVQKTLIYDYTTSTPTLQKTLISESSRLQRKGRVGRVSNGTVYYTYEENSRKHIKTQFNIAVSDVNDHLFDLLRSSTKNSPLFTQSSDPNNINTSLTYLTAYQSGIEKMLQKQYFIKRQYNNYYGNPSQYDYSNYTPVATYYEDGYSRDTLIDASGQFYIIHPDELNSSIRRNIIGKRLGPESIKIQSFLNTLTRRLFIYTNGKTTYGKNFQELKAKLDMTYETFNTYAYSRKYNCDKSIVKLFPTFGKALISNNNRNIYLNKHGDAIGFIMVADRILKYFNKFMVFDEQMMYTHLVEDILRQKKIYLNNKVTKQFHGISPNYINKFIELDTNNRLLSTNTLDKDEMNEFIKTDIILEHIYNIFYKNEQEITKWCERNYFKYNDVSKYVTDYFYLLNKIKKLNESLYDIDYDTKDSETMTLTNFDELLQVNYISETTEESIIRSLLHGFSNNIVKKIDHTNIYLNVNQPSPQNVYSIAKTFYKPQDDTTLSNTMRHDYLLYLASSQYAGVRSISLINKITPKLIQSTNPLTYSPTRFLPQNYNIQQYKQEMSNLLHALDSQGQTTKQNKLLTDYINTINTHKKDMLNNYDKTIWQCYTKLDDSTDYKNELEQIKQEENEAIRFLAQQSQSGGSHTPLLIFNSKNELGQYVNYLFNQLQQKN